MKKNSSKCRLIAVLPKTAMSEATSLTKKHAATFAALKADFDAKVIIN